MDTPQTDCWGIEYTPTGISSCKDLYAVSGPKGIKPSEYAPYIMVCTPSRGTVPVELLMAWKRISIPINTVTGFIYSQGQLSTISREKMTLDAIKLGATYIYYADDDVLPPVNVLYKMLTEMTKDPTIGLLTGVYTTKSDPPHPHIYKHPGEGAYWGFSMDPYDPPEDIWGCGAGAMLVRVDAIKKMTPPYWAERVVMETKNYYDVTGHDLHFCQKVAETGYRVCVDGSLICGHINIENKTIYSIPINSPPMHKLVTNRNTAEYWNKIWGVDCWGNERVYNALYSAICDLITPESRVLDIGAGVGVLLQWLINSRRIYAHAFEQSDMAVDYLNGRFISATKKLVQDIQLTDLQHYGYVVCTEVLEHLDEPVMLNLLSLMSQSGTKCIISVPDSTKGRGAPEGEHLRNFELALFETLLNQYFRFVEVHPVGDQLLAVCRGGLNEKEVSRNTDLPGANNSDGP